MEREADSSIPLENIRFVGEYLQPVAECDSIPPPVLWQKLSIYQKFSTFKGR